MGGFFGWLDGGGKRFSMGQRAMAIFFLHRSTGKPDIFAMCKRGCKKN